MVGAVRKSKFCPVIRSTSGESIHICIPDTMPVLDRRASRADLDFFSFYSLCITCHFNSRQVAMKLEPGWEWIPGDEWRIDWGGSWSAVGTDDQGYVYTDASWQKPASYAYGHGGGVPDYPPSIFDVQQQQADGEDEETLLDHQDEESDVRSTLPPLSAGVVDHDPKMKAETRRRRWLRRAVRSAA